MEKILTWVIELGFEKSLALGMSILVNVAQSVSLFFLARHLLSRPQVEDARLQRLLQRMSDTTKASLRKLVSANHETAQNHKENHAREIALNTAHFQDLLRQRETDVERFFRLLQETQEQYAELVRSVQAEESGSMELVASLLKSLQQITESIATLFATTKSDHERLFNYIELHSGNQLNQLRELSQQLREASTNTVSLTAQVQQLLVEIRPPLNRKFYE